MKLKLDRHEVPGRDIALALQAIMAEAVAKKAPLVEIIPGKGTGALKKHVLKFLDQPENRALNASLLAGPAAASRGRECADGQAQETPSSHTTRNDGPLLVRASASQLSSSTSSIGALSHRRIGSLTVWVHRSDCPNCSVRTDRSDCTDLGLSRVVELDSG